jgi:hypothetical protein
VSAPRARIAGNNAFAQIVTGKNVSHIPSRGKGVQFLPFLNSKKKFRIKGGAAWLAKLHGRARGVHYGSKRFSLRTQ